jgi:hypothetical protein
MSLSRRGWGNGMETQMTTCISLGWLPTIKKSPTENLVFAVGSYYIDLRILKSNQTIEWAMAGKRELREDNPCTFLSLYLFSFTAPILKYDSHKNDCSYYDP